MRIQTFFFLFLLACVFVLNACKKSDSTSTTIDTAPGSGGGPTTPTAIPTVVYGVYSLSISSPEIYGGRVYRVETSNWPSGNQVNKTHLIEGTGSVRITLKNADTDPRIDSSGGFSAVTYYPNIVKADAMMVVPSDTLTKLCVVVNNGSVRRIFVICQLPNVIGSGSISWVSIVKDYYKVTNAFNHRIDTATGLKELQNTFQ